jgi:hypothetical protein
LTQVIWFLLQFNQLSGEIPASLGNLVNANWTHLGYNTLSGASPAELGNQVKLERLNLGVNQLSGQIPASLANLQKLKILKLSNNQLSQIGMTNLPLTVEICTWNQNAFRCPIPLWAKINCSADCETVFPEPIMPDNVIGNIGISGGMLAGFIAAGVLCVGLLVVGAFILKTALAIKKPEAVEIEMELHPAVMGNPLFSDAQHAVTNPEFEDQSVV